MIYDLEDLKEFLGVIAFILILFILIIGLVIACLYPLEKYICTKTADRMNLEYDYAFGSGCLVKVDGRWIDIDNYNEVGVK